jgi:uncharacterized protein (DUF1778 family)
VNIEAIFCGDIVKPSARLHGECACRTIAVQMPSSHARTQRIELRAEPDRARRIRHAARLRRQSLSAFMLDAASESAERVLAETAITTVPPAFFDQLWQALDVPPKPNRALAKRAAARRRVTQR